MGIEAFHNLVVVGDVLVVIALDNRQTGEIADDFQTLLGIGVVADNIAQTHVGVHLFLPADLQRDIQRLQISMNVAENRILHFIISIKLSDQS